MINEKKLLCAFIYSAYDSGYCGLRLGEKEKQRHMKLYREYIKNQEYFPKKEIDETQKIMMDSIDNTGIRDYIYRGHFQVVKDRIEKETKQKFSEIVRYPVIMHAALNCPVNFYEVTEKNESNIVGKNLFLKERRKLIILKGMEKPNVGDVVSSHWNYFLEVVNNIDKLEEYKAISRDYIKGIKSGLN